MITQDKAIQVVDGKVVSNATLFGLSTDTPKPTEGIGNGSAFIEMDTGKIYFYDASEGGSGWIEWGGS